MSAIIRDESISIDPAHFLHSLTGTLNTEPCHGCGVSITVQEPVIVNMESHGIEELCYMPLSYLERGYLPAEELAAPDVIGRTFYSLDELARQVRARIIVKGLRIGEGPLADRAPY